MKSPVKNDVSVELFRNAKKLIPGGVNSPVRAFKSVGSQPLFMKKGEGAYLFDEDDNRYIDYCMSWGPLILGHGDKDVIKAIVETAKHGTSFGAPNRFEVEIAQRVTERFDSIDQVRFVNSGTEATMSAIRLARGYTGRDKIVKFDGCYHGHGDYLLVAAGSGLAGSLLHITPGSGFEGYTSNTQYLNDAVNPRQAWNIYKEGPGGGNFFANMLNKYRLKIAFLKDNQEVGSFDI